MNLSWTLIRAACKELGAKILRGHPEVRKIYGIPRGGIHVAAAISGFFPQLEMVERPSSDAVFVDDLTDTGETEERWRSAYPHTPFYSLIDKRTQQDPRAWVSFPWERMQNDSGVDDNIRRILQYIGEDPKREGLLETPSRVSKSYSELFAGYKQKPEDVLKVFEDGACNEMVILRDVEFVSFCEHHMLPFYGVAHLGYLPKGKVVGVSKLARILEIYAKRLQIQERLTQQVTRALDDHLQPLGSACILEAKHFCMVCRGVLKQNSIMITSSLTGEFLKPEVRQEFLNLIRGSR